ARVMRLAEPTQVGAGPPLAPHGLEGAGPGRQPDEIHDPPVADGELEVVAPLGPQRHHRAARAHETDGGKQRPQGVEQVAVGAAPEAPQRHRVALHDDGRPEPPDGRLGPGQHRQLGALDVELDEVEPFEAGGRRPGVERRGGHRGRPGGGGRQVGPAGLGGAGIERHLPFPVVERRRLDRDVPGAVAEEIGRQVGPRGRRRLEGVDVTGRAELRHEHGEHADVGAAVDDDVVSAQPAPEQPREVGLVGAAAALDLPHHAGVLVAAADGERPSVERPEADGLFTHVAAMLPTGPPEPSAAGRRRVHSQPDERSPPAPEWLAPPGPPAGGGRARPAHRVEDAGGPGRYRQGVRQPHQGLRRPPGGHHRRAALAGRRPRRQHRNGRSGRAVADPPRRRRRPPRRRGRRPRPPPGQDRSPAGGDAGRPRRRAGVTAAAGRAPSGPVLYDLTGAQSPEHRSRGIGRYVTELAAALEEVAGDRVGAFVVDPAFALPPGVEPLVASGRLLAADEILHSPESVVHVASPYELSVPLRRLWPEAAERAGAALVVTLYDVIPEVLGGPYLADPEFRERYRARHELVRAADAVLAISESTARDGIERLRLDPRRVHVNGAGVSPRLLAVVASLGAAPAPRVAGLRERFVLYTGGADPRKNVEGLLTAWSGLDPAVRQDRQLVIVCGLTPLERNHLEVEAARL